MQGDRRASFDLLGNLGKALRLNLDLINSVGQPSGVQVALTIRSECLTVLVALADEVNRGLFTRDPEGSTTVKRSSPVVLWASMGRAHRITAIMSAFFIFNCHPIGLAAESAKMMLFPVWRCPARLLIHLVLLSFGSAFGHLLNGSQRLPTLEYSG